MGDSGKTAKHQSAKQPHAARKPACREHAKTGQGRSQCLARYAGRARDLAVVVGRFGLQAFVQQPGGQHQNSERAEFNQHPQCIAGHHFAKAGEKQGQGGHEHQSGGNADLGRAASAKPRKRAQFSRWGNRCRAVLPAKTLRHSERSRTEGTKRRKQHNRQNDERRDALQCLFFHHTSPFVTCLTCKSRWIQVFVFQYVNLRFVGGCVALVSVKQQR